MNKSSLLKNHKTYYNLGRIKENISGDRDLLVFFNYWFSRIDSIVEQPLNLAIMGEFSSGKSSFVNRLIGVQQLLPIGACPSTATINIIKYGEKPEVKVVYKDGSFKNYEGYSILNSYAVASKIQNIDDDVVLRQEIERVQRIEVLCDKPYLKKFNIIDTPGFNQTEEMDEKTNALLDKIDFVIWLFSPQQAGRKTELTCLKNIAKTVSKIYGVFNRIDEDQYNIKELNTNLDEHFSPVLTNAGNVPGICSHYKKSYENQEFKKIFEDFEINLGQQIFDKDYELSQNRLNELYNELFIAINDSSKKIKTDIEKAELFYNDFKNITDTGEQYLDSEYSNMVKDNFHKIFDMYIEKMSQLIVKTLKSDLLAHELSPQGLGWKSNSIRFWVQKQSFDILNEIKKYNESLCENAFFFFEKTHTAYYAAVVENILESPFYSEVIQKKVTSINYQAKIILQTKKENANSTSFFGYLTFFFLGPYSMNKLKIVYEKKAANKLKIAYKSAQKMRFAIIDFFSKNKMQDEDRDKKQSKDTDDTFNNGIKISLEKDAMKDILLTLYKEYFNLPVIMNISKNFQNELISDLKKKMSMIDKIIEIL